MLVLHPSLSSLLTPFFLHIHNAMSVIEITGRSRDRFIQVVVLLFLLDPARGEPIAYGLDKESSTVEYPRELFLKRKFLDSFALICAIRKDPKSVSAACLEEGQPEGTVVRIASNAGVREDTMISLRRIVDILSSIAARGMFLYSSSHKGADTAILQSLTLLNGKILCYSRSSNLTLLKFDNT